MTLFLCGYKNCGKSTVAKKLTEDYRLTCLDTDALLLAAHPEYPSIREMAETLGHERFAAAEEAVVLSLQATDAEVVALGGGAVMSPRSVLHLKTLGTLVYLQVDLETLQQRMLAAPLLPSFIQSKTLQKDFERYIKARAAVYPAVADKILACSGKSPASIAAELMKVYEVDYGY